MWSYYYWWSRSAHENLAQMAVQEYSGEKQLKFHVFRGSSHMYRRIETAVVRVWVENRLRGMGFLVSERTLLTCAHVLTETRVLRLARISRMTELMSTDAQTIRNAIDRIFDLHPGIRRILLVVDQFEQLYTACTTSRERAQFVSILLRVTQLYPQHPSARCQLL